MGNVEQGEREFQQQLGRQVRRLRVANGLTQGGLAERLTRSGHPMYQTTVTKIEAGSRPTTAAEVAALARIFRLPPGALFDFSDDEDAVVELGRLSDHLGALDARAEQLIAELKQIEDERREIQAQRDDAYASLTASQRAKQDRITDAANRELEREDAEQAARDLEAERGWANFTGNPMKRNG